MPLKILCSFILSLWLVFSGSMPAVAQSGTAAANQVISTTFNQMPPFKSDGAVPDISGLIEQVGYDPQRTWKAGDLPADVVKVGDVESGLGASELSIEQISELTGLDLDFSKIEDLQFLEGISLEQFITDIPFLGEWNVQDIPELAELTKYGRIFSGDQTLSSILTEMPDIANLDVLDVFGGLSVDAIPNLTNAQLKDFAGINEKTISKIPGLGDVSLGSFPIPVSLPSINVFPLQDIPFEGKEYSADKPTPQPVSGGTDGGQTWKPLACSGGCPHIELTDNGWEGANWMTKDHRVNDGFGLLGSLYGEAGAYRLPFGPSFALQIVSTDEKTGKTEWGISFRICKRGIVDLGCTAYFLEVPLGLETMEGDNILTGIRDGLGGSTVPMAAPPEWETLRPDVPPELQSMIDEKTGAVTPTGSGSLCGDGPGGTKLEALAEAFEQIESKGSGGYSAVGIWVNISPGETGRALGKYQYMSYREDVVAQVNKTSGGREFLAKIRSGVPISGDEMLRYFSPAEQDALFLEDQQRNIEKILDLGYEGDRLIEVLGQVHLRGVGVLSNGQLDATLVKDGLGTSVKEYGERFREYYREAETKYPDGEERCQSTGQFINPTDPLITGFSRRFSADPIYNPVKRTQRPHYGDDMLAGQGHKLVASDGGAVEWLQDPGGYGDFMVIVHGNGYETLYAHMSNRAVPNGARVEQGQYIGNAGGLPGTKGAGGSTGAHLHFEVRKDGSPIAPQTVVDYSRSVRDLPKK